MLELQFVNRFTDLTTFKRIPLSWTISSLKNFICKTNKMPINMLKLSLKVDENSGEEEITEDHKTVGYYNVTESSVFFISQAK